MDDFKKGIKKDVKPNCLFDDIIKRIANEIVNKFNNPGMNDITGLKTNIPY